MRLTHSNALTVVIQSLHLSSTIGRLKTRQVCVAFIGCSDC